VARDLQAVGYGKDLYPRVIVLVRLSGGTGATFGSDACVRLTKSFDCSMVTPQPGLLCDDPFYLHRLKPLGIAI